MHGTLDRAPLCRCFDADRGLQLRAAAFPTDDAPDATNGESEPRMPLRPEVHCLQRWIDLNA